MIKILFWYTFNINSYISFDMFNRIIGKMTKKHIVKLLFCSRQTYVFKPKQMGLKIPK